jgi:hypothetical protein
MSLKRMHVLRVLEVLSHAKKINVKLILFFLKKISKYCKNLHYFEGENFKLIEV